MMEKMGKPSRDRHWRRGNLEKSKHLPPGTGCSDYAAPIPALNFLPYDRNAPTRVAAADAAGLAESRSDLVIVCDVVVC